MSGPVIIWAREQSYVLARCWAACIASIRSRPHWPDRVFAHHRLTIGLPPRVAHVIATDFVEQFRAQYPDASVAVTEGPSLRLRELVIAGRVDVALFFAPTPPPQVLRDFLLREPLVLVSKRPLPDRVSLADLVKHRLVMGSAPTAWRRFREEMAPRGGLP